MQHASTAGEPDTAALAFDIEVGSNLVILCCRSSSAFLLFHTLGTFSYLEHKHTIYIHADNIEGGAL
jgi:hypothetical protein